MTVLYEDQLAKGPAGNFRPHSLLLACVADVVGEAPWALRNRVRGSPKKGVDKLLKACREDVRDLARDGRWVVALVDVDRVRSHLQMAATVTEDAVVDAIRASSNAPDQLSVVLLDPNLEVLIRAAEQCDSSLAGPLLAGALAKALNDRDTVLNRIAWNPSPAVRDCILGKVPGFRLLRDRVVCASR